MRSTVNTFIIAVFFNIGNIANAESPAHETVSVPRIEVYLSNFYQSYEDASRAAKKLVEEIERSIDDPLYSHAPEDTARFFGRSNLSDRVRRDIKMQQNLAVLLAELRAEIESNAQSKQVRNRATLIARRGIVLTVLGIFTGAAMFGQHPEDFSIDQEGWLGIGLYLVATPAAFFLSNYIQKKSPLELSPNQKAVLNQIEWLRVNVCSIFLKRTSVKYK